jgi:SPP1 gp7 family putative phage head morphogenesis protein
MNDVERFLTTELNIVPRHKAKRALGGVGSGNFHHVGRPGEIGGSGSLFLHGTAQAHIDSILKEGIKANPPRRAFKTDDGKPLSKKGYTYITSDIEEAKTYAQYADVTAKSEVIDPVFAKEYGGTEPNNPPDQRPGNGEISFFLKGTELGGHMPAVVAVELPDDVIKTLKLDPRSDILSTETKRVVSKAARMYKGDIKPEWIQSISYEVRDLETGVKQWRTVAREQLKDFSMPHGVPTHLAGNRTFYVPVLLSATGEIRTLGGPGSGNHGHAGRPGEVGGSGVAAFARNDNTGRVSDGVGRLIHRMRGWGEEFSTSNPDGVATVVDGVRIIVSARADMGNNVAFIGMMEADEMQKGRGTAMLQRLTDAADTYKVVLALESFPYTPKNGVPIPKEKLTSFYERFGFKADPPNSDGITFMYRDKPLRALGGTGSGNFGHAGRPGEVGGSAGDVAAAIQRGEAHRVSEDDFVAYHKTGSIESDAYVRYEAGDLTFINRKDFDTLLEERMINDQKVEIRLQTEPLQYVKYREALDDATRDRLYDEYVQAAKALGTTPMMAGIDLGHGTEKYNSLNEFEKRWRDSSGDEPVRDEHGQAVYLTPEEVKAMGRSGVSYTVGAFVGDKTVAFAGDEFGATGVYVVKDYQRHGLGTQLLKTYLEKSGRLAKGQKIGQMTYAGTELTRAIHRKLVAEAAARGLSAATGPAETLVHEAADAFVPKVLDAVLFGFDLGKAAINRSALRNAKTADDVLAALEPGFKGTERYLTRVLPRTLADVVAAGGLAGMEMLARTLRTAGGVGSGNFGHVGRPGQIGGSMEAAPDSGGSGGTVDPARAVKIARIKELKKLMQPMMANGGYLTKAQAASFEKMNAEIDDLTYDLVSTKKFNPEKLKSDVERQSTLSPATIAVAHADLFQNKDIFKAISVAAAGTYYDADTPVDDIFNGKNSKVTAKQFIDTFANTREALRKQYGDVVPAYRATGQQITKATQNWATTKEFAANFGSNIVQRDIPVDVIAAVNVGASGNYHELIVDTRVFRGAEDIRILADDKKKKKNNLFNLEFDYTNPDVLDWAEQHAADLITGIDSTTRKKIRQYVADALDSGSLDELERQLIPLLGDKDRAELIAHTETMAAANEGQRQSWQQAIDEGYLDTGLTREWIATADEVTCPICNELNGKRTQMDGEYPNGGGVGPPAHPRCRCTEGIVG